MLSRLRSMRSGKTLISPTMLSHLAQHVVDQDRRVRQDHTLDAAVRDVALMPKRNIFVRREHVGAHQPGQPANLLARHRIALVRHGGTAALLAAKMFFRLAHFGALQMPDFQRNFFERRRDQRQRTHIMCMPVALNHLRGHRRDVQSQPRANLLFDFGAEMRSISHRTGNLPKLHRRAASRKRAMLR